MMFMDELYQKGVAENEKNLQFWENYLNGLKSLDFDVYTNKLKVPILVPIGNKILFRGELQHTNEVTVALGADYFAKCSIAQAEILRQHRIKDAQSKVDLYMKEKEYLENRLTFTRENVFAKDGQEILEEYSEEQEKAWREKHKENVKKYKQTKVKEESEPNVETSDAELWERLEELELQEELENELLENYNEIVDRRKENTFVNKEESVLQNSFNEENNNQTSKDAKENTHGEIMADDNEKKQFNCNEKPEIKDTNDSAKHNLLQKVLDKQNELENKLNYLKNREREPSKTEKDLIARLDEIEQLDELEDDIERLDDILETEDVNTGEDLTDSDKSDTVKIKKSISFADDNDDAETIDIGFSHTDTEANKEPFNPEKGIVKPSDVYEMYSHLFDNKTTSILKKSKYGDENIKQIVEKPKRVMFEEKIETLQNLDEEQTPVEKTIVIGDVVENIGVNQHHIEGGARPTSLFKKKRMQKK